jgi:hypothetical protein
MRRLLAILTLSCFPLPVVASDFDWLVREFSRESGARQVHVPFFGLARFAVAVGHPAGARDVKLAIFERGDLESLRFSALTDSTVGGSWKPMIRVRERNGESTNIYVREEGKNLNVLITSLDGDDATFVQVRLEPRALIRFVDEHGGAGHHFSR